MTRILVQRGSSGSSSNPSQTRSHAAASAAAAASSSSVGPLSLPPSESLASKASLSSFSFEEEEQNYEDLNEPGIDQEIPETNNNADTKFCELDDVPKEVKACETDSLEDGHIAFLLNSLHLTADRTNSAVGKLEQGQISVDLSGITASIDSNVTNSGFKPELASVELGVYDTSEKPVIEEDNSHNQFGVGVLGLSHMGYSCPPPPPLPPSKPMASSTARRVGSCVSSTQRSGSSRRNSRATMASRSSPTGSHPSSPRSHGDGEGYNSADEQSPCFGSYDDAERERQFENEIRRSKGLEVRRMIADGNCLFRAVADQVYGDPEVYDVTRQMCIDYMEKERDHFSQFVTESFTAYSKRKRRDKVYGNNLEIQAMSEIYNRPIHIYSYSTEPINIFHGSYGTDSPPIRLSYHRGNHYNSLVDPHRLTIGAGLGFSSLQGKNIDKDQVKAAIKAQQDQQIENALLAEGRFYSDLELTEKEIERMVMEASRAEYLAQDKYRQQFGYRESSTSSGAEPSSSATGTSRNEVSTWHGDFKVVEDTALSRSIHTVLSMGFSPARVIEAHSIFGDDVESMVCYLLETGTSSPGGESIYRMKGKAAEK